MIKLSIEVVSPLTPDDHELLSGIAVMTLAIANHEMAKQAFPETFGGEEEAAEPDTSSADETSGLPEPLCGVISEPDGLVCVGVSGHRGRHRFRLPTMAN